MFRRQAELAPSPEQDQQFVEFLVSHGSIPELSVALNELKNRTYRLLTRFPDLQQLPDVHPQRHALALLNRETRLYKRAIDLLAARPPIIEGKDSAVREMEAVDPAGREAGAPAQASGVPNAPADVATTEDPPARWFSIPADLPHQLLAARNRLRLSWNQAAEKIKVDPKTLRKVRRGNGSVDGDVLRAVEQFIAAARFD